MEISTDLQIYQQMLYSNLDRRQACEFVHPRPFPRLPSRSVTLSDMAHGSFHSAPLAQLGNVARGAERKLP